MGRGYQIATSNCQDCLEVTLSSESTALVKELMGTLQSEIFATFVSFRSALQGFKQGPVLVSSRSHALVGYHAEVPLQDLLWRIPPNLRSGNLDPRVTRSGQNQGGLKENLFI